MRPRGLLLRLPAALTPGPSRVVAATLALCLLAPGLVAPGGVAASWSARDPTPGSGSIPSAGLPPPPGTTTLVSRRPGGAFPSGASAQPSISSSGRWVAFASTASDLVANDDNGSVDVFVRDRSAGTTVRLGLPNGRPVPSGGSAYEPSISGDGSLVAFTYQPPPGITGALSGTLVLAWERKTGNVTVVSFDRNHRPAITSSQPSVSGTGRYIAYTSNSFSMSAIDGNEQPDVFRYDRTSEETDVVSVGFDGTTPSGTSNAPAISSDGRRIAFTSTAGDSLLDEDTGNDQQVYLRDMTAKQTERISGAPGGGRGGAPANGPALAPAISANGRFVAFESTASNLVTGDTNNTTDVFRRDRTTGATVLVSVAPSGAAAAGSSGQASISADGHVVAFSSSAPDVLGGVGRAPAARTSEVYARDLDAGDTVLVSVRRDGGPGGLRSLTPVVNGSGRYVAFVSTSARILPKDDNQASDVFIRDFPPHPLLTPAALDLGSRAVGTTATPVAAILSNTGWSPLGVTGASIKGTNRTNFALVLDGCAGRVLRRGEACTMTVTFTPRAEGTRKARLEVADAFTGSPRVAQLRGKGSQARLALDPPIGPPGTVVIATGRGFPAGAVVLLSWSTGITPHLKPVKADAKGRFRVQVLVFHNDRVGIRDLVATPADGSSFPVFGVPMLVSQPSVVPPGFLLQRRFVDLPLVLLIRG